MCCVLVEKKRVLFEEIEKVSFRCNEWIPDFEVMGNGLMFGGKEKFILRYWPIMGDDFSANWSVFPKKWGRVYFEFCKGLWFLKVMSKDVLKKNRKC